MKIILIFISVSVLVIISVFVVLAIISRFSEPPKWSYDKLTECPKKPNCVCSEYKNDRYHYIEPVSLDYTNNLKEFSILTKLIKKMGGKIEREDKNYIHATFSSRLFGFIDDLQLRLDASENKIHIRSSSRVGYSDGGVNRRRIEMFKRLFEDSLLSKNK